MASISICGNVGRDPELKQAGQSQVLSFSVADSEYIYSKGNDAEAQWFNVELWGKRAESLAPILSKGQKITVYGQLVQRSYEGANGKGKSLDIKDARVSIVSKRELAADSSANSYDAPF